MVARRTTAGILIALSLAAAATAQARTVYRCVRDGTVSLATAPEPGSRCVAKHIDDDAVKLPNLWGALGVVTGTLYEREQDGKRVYSTRNLPGSTPMFAFAIATPPGEPAHAGLGDVGSPRVDRYARQFRTAANKYGVDDALLRAVAHAESAFDAKALSPKGAQGVMQLMPETARRYGVTDAYSAEQSIDAGARHLRLLLRRYRGDVTLAAAAYNAGDGAVSRYGGVPPYRETQSYIAKVQQLHAGYRRALGNGTPAAGRAAAP